MKAEIISGELMIFPETNTEHYAIVHLVDDFKHIDKPMSITIDTELVDGLYD